MCCLQEMLATSGQVENRALARRTESEVSGRGRPRFDLIADPLHDRRDALRGVDARHDNVLFVDSELRRCMNRLEQLVPVPRRDIRAEVAKRFRRFHRHSSGVERSPRHNHRVSLMLLQERIGLDVQRESGGIPDDLVDADNGAARAAADQGDSAG